MVFSRHTRISPPSVKLSHLCKVAFVLPRDVFLIKYNHDLLCKFWYLLMSGNRQNRVGFAILKGQADYFYYDSFHSL